MLWFEKGDPRELEGRGAIYLFDMENSKHPGLLFGATPADLIQVMRSYGKEVSPEVEKSVLETYHLSLDEYFRHEEEDDENYKPGCVHAGFMNIEPLSNVEGDVIHMESVHSSKDAAQTLVNCLNVYFTAYRTQQWRKMPDTKGYTSTVKNFRELEPEGFSQEFHRLAGKLMYALECETGVEEATADLKKLSEGAPFIGDVTSFYDLTQGNHPNKTKIMELYSRKVVAIVKDDFEEAGRLNTEIEQLLQSKD
ncbi:MAG: hypothetical protein ISS93_01310 [Candidatus Aenigmarchaeota archaeon]|nr:hypothetical protein [Candidatus Aenigmarchaeota archaeon]